MSVRYNRRSWPRWNSRPYRTYTLSMNLCVRESNGERDGKGGVDRSDPARSYRTYHLPDNLACCLSAHRPSGSHHGMPHKTKEQLITRTSVEWLRLGRPKTLSGPMRRSYYRPLKHHMVSNVTQVCPTTAITSPTMSRVSTNSSPLYT